MSMSITRRKWYGPRNIQPIIAIHGRQDNCGTFDKLAPILAKQRFTLFCIDLPGHGLSSPYPEGLIYNHWYDGVYVIRRLVKFYNWTNIIILGHSSGGGIAFLYAAIYPNDIAKYISIDNCCPSIKSPLKILPLAASNIDTLFDHEKGYEEDISGTYQEILTSMMETYSETLDKEGCEILLRRGIKFCHGKECYSLTRDPRLKIDALTWFTMDKILDFASMIKCEILNIRADRGMELDPPENYDIILDAIEGSQTERIVRVFVDGTHYVHLIHPEVIASIIINFLNSQ
ncbi:probable serine hydrolase [Diorhabda carinulata]|uniref:probable serine hydrolase n=1 Tax=Diorhabda carinulata TaxID=1163345 RepID=UPI0025A00655|nr:probable serine hydrolase [Diorhabda carinulata]